VRRACHEVGVKVALIGGTGPEGIGMAVRFGRAGIEVLLGSRDLARAQDAASRAVERAVSGSVRGCLNDDAARQADLVVVVVPYAGHEATLRELAAPIGSKVLVDAVVPLVRKGRSFVIAPLAAGSAAQEAQILLPDARVVAAFQTVGASELQDVDHEMEGDVVVCADDPQAKTATMDLVRRIPVLRPVDGGGLAHAGLAEHVTALLLNINRVYRAHTGIRITGLPGG